jgi:nucleoside-diphosphate kinase
MLLVLSEMASFSTFVMIKSDAVARGLIGEIITRFEKRGLRITHIKNVCPTVTLMEDHYKDLKNESFFEKLITRMTTNGDVIAMVVTGVASNTVDLVRFMLGTTNPAQALPGTIRGDLSLIVEANVCHASDSIKSAEREISLWWPDI